MACCRFYPVRRYTFLIDDQSERRPSRRRATRPRRRACSTFSALCISGNVGKGRVKIVSPRFCAFRPRRRVSAAPSRRARKPVKTPPKKMKFKIKRCGVSTLRDGAALTQGRDIPALHPLDTARTRHVSTVPDTQNLLGVEHTRLRSLVA